MANTTKTAQHGKQGFASMDKNKVKEIASKGGQNSRKGSARAAASNLTRTTTQGSKNLVSKVKDKVKDTVKKIAEKVS